MLWANRFAPSPLLILHSFIQMAAAVCDCYSGSPCKTWWMQKSHPPTHPPQTSLNCKQCSCSSYEYTRYGPHHGVDLREGCVMLHVRLCGISCGALSLSLGSSGGQPLKWLDLALVDDSDIRRQPILDTRLWVMVRKRWGRSAPGPFLKTWRSSPPPWGTAEHKWNPWIMNTLEVRRYLLQPILLLWKQYWWSVVGSSKWVFFSCIG